MGTPDQPSEHIGLSKYPLLRGAVSMGDHRGNTYPGGGAEANKMLNTVLVNATTDLRKHCEAGGPQLVYFEELRADQGVGPLDAKLGFKVTMHRHDMAEFLAAFKTWYEQPTPENHHRLRQVGEGLITTPESGYQTEQVLYQPEPHDRPNEPTTTAALTFPSGRALKRLGGKPHPETRGDGADSKHPQLNDRDRVPEKPGTPGGHGQEPKHGRIRP